MLTQLESHPYNLRCIAYERDFAPGQALTNCMEQAVRQSMKTIIILTKAYLNSSWCRLEQGLALTMSIQDRGNRVIPILKEPCEIPDTLKVIRYQNANWDREYLIQKLLDALKSSKCSTLLHTFFLYVSCLVLCLLICCETNFDMNMIFIVFGT